MSQGRELGTDPAHDIVRMERPSLDPLFSPRLVAVVGAAPETDIGQVSLGNLRTSAFAGHVVAVGAEPPDIPGVDVYDSIGSVPGPIDLAVVVSPAPDVPAVIGACVDAGVKSAIVTSAGFREIGPTGLLREQQIRDHLRRGAMRLIGPNCLGVMRPATGLNATYARTLARPGTVGFVSQSGALCTAILDWSMQEHVGFSAFVSAGAMLDVEWGDLIDYLGSDPQTHSILIYMEMIGDARAFLSAAREVARSKPIIVLKAGRTSAAAQAAVSHTGGMAGSDAVLDAAFRRSGVLRVNTIAELFYMAGVLAKQPRPQGRRLMIVTNAGGPGVLATDALTAEGGELATLAPATVDALEPLLPEHWSRANPIDIGDDAGPERFARTVEIAAGDPGADGLLVILTPQSSAEPGRTAELLRPFARIRGKPLLASWMGGEGVAHGDAVLNAASIPTFSYPDTAARVFCAMWRYTYNLRALYETPLLDPVATGSEAGQATYIVEAAHAAGRTLLTEPESKAVLAAYGIPTVETRVARSPDEAVAEADALGYPVVLKLLSSMIAHKSAVGGVRLNLIDATDVRRAYQAIQEDAATRAGLTMIEGVAVQPMLTTEGIELIVGSSTDPQFGPVLLFGAGGRLVEVIGDRALGLPPLNTTLARRMMEQTRVYAALRGALGSTPIDREALEQILVRFSQLVVEQRRIKEIDVNPLLAATIPAGAPFLALDARIVLHEPTISDEALPVPAIRPYPTQYIRQAALKDGAPMTIRPIRAEDETLMVRFHQGLSMQSVYNRYFHMLHLDQRVAHERLTAICFIDYDREMALVAERRDPQTGAAEIIAVGRLSKLRRRNQGEFAILVRDDYQGNGLGRLLLSLLIKVGQDERLSRITADILPENRAMQHIARQIGFRVSYSREDEVTKAILDL